MEAKSRKIFEEKDEKKCCPALPKSTQSMRRFCHKCNGSKLYQQQCCRNSWDLSDNRTFFQNVRQKTPVCRTKCPTKIFRPKKKYRARKLVIREKWRRSWQNKNKRKEKQIRRWNKAKYEANCTERSFQHGCKCGWPWLAFEDRSAAWSWPTTSRLARLSIRIESIMSFRMILVIVCH